VPRNDSNFRACTHGGAFFEAIGEGFDHLERRHQIIAADVLDAWFPPAPGVLESLSENLAWLLSTSPPTQCAGLIEAIAASRGVGAEHILPGAGSSDLIFRVLRHWLTRESRALILDPSYGEYAHVLEHVIGVTVDRLPLAAAANFALDTTQLESALARNYDLVVLINPNSPTGQHTPRAILEPILARAPKATRIWIDETYVEYAGWNQSLEKFAAASDNVIVCKSMSKVYALSGARVAYLCADARLVTELQAITPPWVVSLFAQVAAVRALEASDYYQARYVETAQLREQLAPELRAFGWNVVPGVTNFLLCQISGDAPALIARCQQRGLFLRDAASMSASFDNHWLRIAVKDAATNARIIQILREVLDEVGARDGA
jgi:histidinol-phosphate/aromatic aminotransferase/cobyric acid decarboxylase-like protein